MQTALALVVLNVPAYKLTRDVYQFSGETCPAGALKHTFSPLGPAGPCRREDIMRDSWSR